MKNTIITNDNNQTKKELRIKNNVYNKQTYKQSKQGKSSK